MKNIAIRLAFTLALMLVIACGGQSTTDSAASSTTEEKSPETTETLNANTETPEPSETPAASVVDVEITAAMQAKLTAADVMDGAEDQVVSKCGGCALAMDGSAENALKIGDYAMNFCSDFCKTRFAEKPIEEVEGLAVPESGP